MTTLANIRAKLNDDMGIATDGDTVPWTTSQRNNAISDAYADLWRAGVWKDAYQDITTADDTWTYALTSIRKLYRLEALDSSGRITGLPRGIVEPDGSGAGTYQVRLTTPISSSLTLRVRGWAPYKSVFSGDADTDDLAAEHLRVPLAKARAILWRMALAKFAKYGERQAIAPEMNVTMEGILALIASAEREYQDLTRMLAGLRPRAGITGKL